MRKTGLILTSALLLALSGCGKSASGTYACSGIPMLDKITLNADGSYRSEGKMLGHAVTGSGNYSTAGKQISLNGTDSIEGLPGTEPNTTVFERQGDGSLKWILATCTKQ